MKILHLFFSFKIGGAELMLRDIMNIQILNNEVSLLIINDEIDQTLVDSLDPKIRLYRLGRKKGSKNPIPLFKLNWIINTMDTDVIHCHVLSIAKYLITGKTLFATKHNLGFFDPCWARYKCIFAISEAVHKEILAYAKYETVLAPNGILIDLVKRKTSSKVVPDIYKLVCVGRLLHETKGQHVLLEAIHELVHLRGVSNLMLDVMGGGVSMEFLLELCDSLNISDYVSFVGEKDRKYVYDNLCTYDIFVLPSINEGLGLSVVEAMAAKVPVLVSSSMGPKEVVKGGKYGYMFENGNKSDLADKLSDMMENYPKAVQRADMALKHINTKYRIENTEKIYNETYMLLK